MATLADHGPCECPLVSRHCKRAHLLRTRWFHAVRSQDAAAIEKTARLCGHGSITHEVFAVSDDESGKDALHIAAREGLQDALEQLLTMLQDTAFSSSVLDDRDGEGVTPLIEACKSGYLSAVKALCLAGAKFSVPDALGMLPPEHAQLAGHQEIVDFLASDSMGPSSRPATEAEPPATGTEPPSPGGEDDGSTVPTPDEGGKAGHLGGLDQAGPEAAEAVEGNLCEGEVTSSGQAPSRTQSGEGSGSHIPSRAPSAAVEASGLIDERNQESPPVYLSPDLAGDVMRVLCNVSFFPSMDATSLKTLSQLCKPANLPKGETLVKQDGDAQSMYVIVKGTVLVRVEQLEQIPAQPDRQWSIRHRLKTRAYRRRLSDNDCFGENVLLIGDKLSFSMEAEQDTEMLELDRRSFNHFIQHHRRVTPDLGSFLAGTLIDANDSIDDSQEAELAHEMHVRICQYYNLPDEDEEPEELKRSTVRGIVEIPLAESPQLKQGLNAEHSMLSMHGCYNNPVANRDNDAGYFAYLRICEEQLIRPRNAILLSLRNAHLRLDNVGLTTKEGLALGGGLTKNAFVKSLDVSSNRLFNEAFVGIEAGGKVDQRSSIKVSARGKGILQAIAGKTEQFESINLQQTQLGKCTSFGHRKSTVETFEILGQIAEFNAAKALQTLKLGSNFLGCDGAVAIAEAMHRNYNNCRLTFLDLSNNCIKDKGATALGTMLESNSTLLDLDAGWNHIGEAGSAALFEGMADNESLKTLQVGWNRVGQKGGEALGRMFFHNKTLERIDLQNCGIPGAACEAIADGIKENQSIQSILMQWNPLGTHLKLLVEALTTSPAKPLFNLENCMAKSQKASTVDPRKMTQSYRFDLSNEKDRESLQPLIALGIKECGQNWRNEQLDGKRFHFPEQGDWPVPNEGIVEFDFVEMEAKEDADGDGIPDTMDKANFRGFIRQLGRILSSEGRIQLIMQATCSYSFDVNQVIEVVGTLPRSIEKQEALVHMFSRIEDRNRHMPMILLRCVKRHELVALQGRLGPEKVFDEHRPAGPYRLILSKHEDRRMLKRLKEMKAVGKFKGSDCSFAFRPGLLRGFKGEILDEAIKVEDIDLDQLASECRSWAKDDYPDEEELARREAIAGEASVEETEDQDQPQVSAPTPGPRIHTLEFDFEMVEMNKSDMDSVLRGMSQQMHTPTESKLPPIAVEITSKERQEEENTEAVPTPVGFFKKKKSPSKKVKRVRSNENTEPVEDLDRKSIFPIPRTMEDVQGIQQIKDFTSMTKLRRNSGNEKALTMIEKTWVRSKHVTQDGLKLRGGPKKWRPWATFTRSHVQDYAVHPICITGGHNSGGGAGRIHEIVPGELCEASCLNWSIDLELQIMLHTIPRVINFWVVARPKGDSRHSTFARAPKVTNSAPDGNSAAITANDLELSLFANLDGLPCASSFIWQGQQNTSGDLVISIRPNDANYVAGTYHLSLITQRHACDFDLHVQVTPFAQIYDELDDKNGGQPLPGRVRHVDNRAKMLKKMLSKTADKERIFFDITKRSSTRVLSGKIGMHMPPKTEIPVRPMTSAMPAAAQPLHDRNGVRSGTSSSDQGRSDSVPLTLGGGVGHKDATRDERAGAKSALSLRPPLA